MNPQATELIQIPKSLFQSMTTRLLGIKNLIRIFVAKENELRVLKEKYQKMEAEYSKLAEDFISEKMRDFSECECSQAASYHSLPLQNSCAKTKQVGVSEETYYDVLKQLCHAKSVLSTLRKTSDKPLMIESWTQTNEKETPTEIITELLQNLQAQQNKMERQQLELESFKEKNADLSKQLEQEASAKKSAMEKEKRSSAKLKRELELHEKTNQKLQKLMFEIKAKEIPKNTFKLTTCSSEVGNDFLQCDFDAIEVDCGDACISTPKKCKGCQQLFSTDKEIEYHMSICQKLKQSSND